jgi:FeS assembly SUF system protein
MDKEIENQNPGPTPWDAYPMEDGPIEAGLVGKAGAPLDGATEPASREAMVEALKTVYDPEIPVDIYELGLIYEIKQADDGDVKVDMTLTAPGCPVAGILPQQVADAVSSVPGTGGVEVFLVWDPPWDMEKMSEEAKLALGMF